MNYVVCDRCGYIRLTPEDPGRGLPCPNCTSTAADRFRMDVAEVWDHIGHGWYLPSDGRLVTLEADPGKRQGTLWIVEEVEQ